MYQFLQYGQFIRQYEIILKVRTMIYTLYFLGFLQIEHQHISLGQFYYINNHSLKSFFF